jgi:hypothetical protein
MTVWKIYLDMDGVLADFERGIRELCHMEPQSQNGKRSANVDPFSGRLPYRGGEKNNGRPLNLNSPISFRTKTEGAIVICNKDIDPHYRD